MEAKPGRISNRHVSITGHAVEANDMSSDVIVIGSFSLMHSVISNKISVKLSETEKRVQVPAFLREIVPKSDSQFLFLEYCWYKK